MLNQRTNDLFKVGDSVVQLYTRMFRTSEKKSSVDDINKKPDKKRIYLTRTLFNYPSNSKAKIRVTCVMVDHLMNELFKTGSVKFSKIILFTSKQLFASRNITYDHIRNEKFQQRYFSNILLFAEKGSTFVTHCEIV
jgi:hypothetical protein